MCVNALEMLPSDLHYAFDRLVNDAAGEFGPTPLARLMAAHLPLFTDLHRRGASWALTADLLTACGVTSAHGPFTASVVRATYSRVCAAANVVRRNEAQPAETKRNPAKQDDAVRQADGGEGREITSIGPERNAANRNAAPRNAGDGNDAEYRETESALHKRAGLLNHQLRKR